MNRLRRPALAHRAHRSLRRSPRAVWRLLRLTPLGAGVAVVAGLPAISAWAQATGVAANVIKPDGRTATQQQVVGTRTDITTGTVRGDNAFNSFSRFEVGQGQTVNVHVPAAAQRVINIVTDAPVRVDGVLNGLKNGSISGNLVFADPMGMVVGKNGVVNVNSLHVTTPTRAHLDAMLDGQGRIGDVAVQQLLDGKAPRSAEGRVQIDGQINALERVRIEARRIDVEGRIKAGVDAAHDAAFRSAVSSNGLASATGMVERGGVIELVSDEGLRVAGTLDASQRQAPTATAPATPDAAPAGLGGSVQLLGEHIELAATAQVDVSGLQGGGVAVIGSVSKPVVDTGDAPIADAPVTQTLVVAKGAVARADAVERGNGGRLQFLSDGSLDFGGFGSSRGGSMLGHGGFVELSGRRRIQVHGLVVTTAPKGNTGVLLIDPDDLHITNGAAGDSACLASASGDCNITTGTIAGLAASNNLVLQADKTLTFGGSDGSAVDLDLSGVLQNHGTQSISFTAQDITFNANSRLVTGGGDVKLYALGAQDTGLLGTGKFSYSSNIGWGPLSIGSKVEGGTVHLQAGSAIITRGVSSGDAASGPLARQAGDVTLRAGTVQIDDGAAILAQGGGGFAGGAVELTAYALQQWNLGKASATAQVTLAGTVKADTIAVNAVARAEATPDGTWGYATTLLGQAFGAASGLGAAYHETQADARINVTGTAVLEAAGTLDIAAASENKAAGSVKVFTIDEKGANLASAAAAYVKTAGEADLQVRNGAQLTSGGKATLGAYNNATAKSSVKVLSNNSIGGAVVSYMAADVSATANVEAGAVLKVNALELAALQTGNMRNVAQSTIAQQEQKQGEPPPPSASIGASVAISDIKAHSTATLGASLSGVGNVTVVADTSLWQNYIAARNDVGGDPTIADKANLAIGGAITSYAQNNVAWLKSLMELKYATLGALAKGSPPVKAGAVVTFNETDLSSKAQIGANAKITSTGQVAVIAQTEDRSVHNVAESKVNTKNAPTTEPVVNAAVAVGLYEHGAEATVGADAEISAKVFGTYADVYQPLDVTWLAAFSVDGLRDPAALFKRFAPPNFGMPHYVFTSWATALAEQDKIKDPNGNDTAAITGSVNWTSFTNTAKSWVGSGAKITASDADRAWSVSWTAPSAPLLDGDTTMNGQPANAVSNILLETQDLVDVAKTWTTNAIGEVTDFFNGGPVVLGITLRNSLDFTKAVDVKARNQSAFLTLTGQPVDFGMSSVNLGSQGGKLAVGGAFNYSGAEHTTVAGIDDGAVVKALAGTVAVDALGQDRIIAIAPTAGTGKGVAANLIAAYSELDNTTVAVLSNKADVQAQALSVKATEDVSVWSAAGAAAFGASTAAVGVAVAVNELDGRTLATIGDPGALSVGNVRPDGFSGRAATGAIDVWDLSVLGLTQGTSGAVAASASAVETKDQQEEDKQVEEDPKSGLSKKWESLKAKTSSLRESAVTKLASDGDGKIAKLRNTLADKIKAKQEASDPDKPYKTSKFSLSAAGSATVNLGNLDTSSIINGASIANKATKPANAADTSRVTARAVNDTHQYSVSGSLALLKLNAPETKAGYGVSGAIAIDLENNDTLAHVVNTTIKDYGRVGVESLASGQRISVGLGIAGSSGSKPAYMLSASYSMTESDNSTVAAIDGGKISSSSDAARTGVEVLSYDETETGVGAGALTVQKNKGGAAGASIGVALVRNEVESRIAGMDSEKLSSVDVRAFDPVTLGIGAASLGISTDQKSTTIEGSVTYGEVANVTRAHVSDRNGVTSKLNASGAVTVQATDVTPTLFKNHFNGVLSANGTPAKDAEYDFGASLRSGSAQEAFGGQSIGTSQPGALVIGVAGGIAVGSGNSAGASAALSYIASTHEALVEGATLNADHVNVDATDSTLMVNVGIGVAGTSSKVALAGSVAVTVDETRATARVGNAGKTTSITTTGANGVDITSATSAKAFAVAGAVAISTQGSSGGIAGTVGVDAAVAEAQVKHATLNTGTAGVSVLGSTASQHVSVAAAGGYGANAAINGSFVVNFETSRTTASVSDSAVTAGGLEVKAGDSAALASQVYTGAGSIGFSKDVAGGAALTSNTVALTRNANVDRSTLTLGSGRLDVQADAGVKMIGVTLAGGGGTNVAFNGAISSNEIANQIKAGVSGSAITTTGDVNVVSGDRSEMNYGTGSLSVSSQTAIGVAIGSNLIINDVSAEFQGTDVNGLKAGSGVANVGNLRVAASSDEKIVNAAYGVSVGSSVGGAGSISVNVIDSDVTAHIGRGADVHASGTVAVTATAQDDIKSFGGAVGLSSSGAGVGLSSTVNVIRGATEASIGADDEAQVKLDAKGDGDGLAVNSGTLTVAIPGVTKPGDDPTAFNGLNAMQNYDATRAKMAEGTTTVKGVAVNATSMRHVLSFDTNVGGAADGVGIGANAGAHVISSATTAEVANAALNQRDSANSAQDVAVKASSHHVMSTFGFSAGGASGAGGAAALGGDIFITQTTARIRDSQVKAARDVTVKGFNESAQSGILAGIAAAGGGALAGSTGVIVFDAGVEASILGGSTRAGDDVVVDADNTSVMNMITGAGSLSGGLALSGAITVLVADLDTHAYIGRDTDTGKSTKVSAGGDVDVTADSTSQINTFTFAISGGGATSVAAIGAVGVATNETQARVSHADLEVGVADNWVYAANAGPDSGGTVGEPNANTNTTSSAAPTGTLNIKATDHGIVNQLSGAAGISFGGGGGVGGTVSVMVARSNVSAELKSSEVDTQDLDISALNSQDQLAATVGVGGSTDVGAGFAISLTMTGTGSPGSEAFGNASNSNSLGTKLMNRAAAVANTNRLGETADTMSAADRSKLQAESKRDISNTLTQSGANSSAAFVDASTVRAGQNVTVEADQETALKNIAGAAGVGLLAGAGGTVGVSYVYNASAAQVTGSDITAGGALKIEADSADKGGKHAMELLTIAGGAGFAGLGASVGVGRLENQVSAQASGQLKAASVTLNATDSTSAKAENVAAAAGGGALGIAVSTVDRAGTVQAWVNKGGASNQVVDAGSLSVNASTTQDNDVISRAVAAGLGISGNGAAGTIDDEVHVQAGIGDNSQIKVGGPTLQAGQAVSVQATRGSSLDSGAEGVGVSGGVQIGASVALAELGGSTQAKVGKNVVFDAGATLSVIASEDSGNNITATGTASGGGALVGANATVAEARNTALTSASIGDGTLLPDGAVVVHATHAATQHADSSGVTVGGLLALGANTSSAVTSATTSATLGNVKTRSGRMGDLDVAAQGTDTTTAKALAGGGGTISGQAATALVTDNTSTTATISAALGTAKTGNDYIIRGGALTVDATHTALVRADADTVNASVVGASGAITTTKVENSAAASVGDDVRLRGLGIGITSNNAATETGSGDNTAGASGGVANGSAVVSTTQFKTDSSATVEDNAKLDVIGDPSSDLVGRLVIVAGTNVATHTQGSLNTGGLIDIPYAEITSQTDAKNTVRVGSGTELRSAGDLILGTSTLNRTSATALIKTYGGIGITGGSSTAESKQTDLIQLLGGALLHAYGNISLATGRNADNAVNLMQADAVTDVYNNTVLPISYKHPAKADITQNSSLDLAEGSKVLAGRSVYLRTFKGDQIVSAVGEGHNPYLEIFSTSTTDSKPSQSFTGSMTLNGAVTAGYYRLRDIGIAADGTLTQNVDTPDNQLEVRTFSVDASGVYRNAANQVVDSALALKPQGYIARIDGFNPSLYYDAEAKTKLGNVPNAVLGAYVLPDLVAAGGNIEVDATSVSGAGSLRAQGGPLIKVLNKSNRFLIGNKLVIPDIDSGGGVSFTGSGSAPSSLTVQEVDKGRLPSIDLHNAYDIISGGLPADIVLQAGDDGANTVRNLRGSFKMINDHGNVWGSTPEALSVDIQVPNGTYVIESSGYYPLGGAPQATWAATDALYRPNDIHSFVDTAAYAYYWYVLGGRSGDAGTYSRHLQGTYDNKGSGINGYLFRPNLGNQPTSGGNWYDGRYNFDTLPVKSLSGNWNGAPLGATKSPGLLANRVNISAAYIDINADIRAGTARDINVTINNTAVFAANWSGANAPKLGFFDCVNNTLCRAVNGIYAEPNGLYKVPTAALTYGANSPQLTVTYDPVTQRVSTAPIGTASVGAITLVGRILNSNADGSARSKIELSTGTIQLNINNQSGRAFEMPRIETGGASGDGVIRITDLNKLNGQYKPLTTFWVSKNGSDVDLYQSYTETDYTKLTPITSGGGATEKTYDPQAGWRYQWTRSASASRSFTRPAGATAWWDFYASSWSFAYGASSPNWSVSGVGPVYAPGNANVYSTQITQSTSFSGGWNVGYSYNGTAQRNWYVATNVTLNQKSTVRADFGLDVSFKGYSSGGVTFASNADTYLGTTINNPTGDTSLTLTNGASLIARDGGLIRTRNLTLNAAGNIGGVGQAKALELDLGGWLNTTSRGKTAISATGDLRLAGASVGNGQQLKLKAVGDITSTDDAVTLVGHDIELTSVGGRIGGATAQKTLNLNVSSIGPGVTQRGLLSATANGDIDLKLSGGDTRVAGITAADGNVTISTNGSLFDAKEGQGGSGRSETELQALWEQTLKISGDKGASVQDYLRHTIVPLDQQVNRDYRSYWQLRGFGTLNAAGTQITLNAKGLGQLRAQAAAAYKVANPSDDQVNQWANTLLARYASTFDTLLGSGWRSQAAFQTQDAAFRFSADRYNEYWTLKNATDAAGQLTTAGRDAIRQVAATVIGGTPTNAQLQTYVNQRFAKLGSEFSAALGSGWASQAAFTSYDAGYRLTADNLLATYAFGSYWGAERLTNEIRQSAFGQPGNGSGSSIDHINISGRTVKLTSSAAHATLGRDNGYLTLTLGQPLSDIQRYALSQASAPGDVQVVTNTAGQITALKVKDTRPLFVDAKTRFDATALGQLYVLAQGSLAIGSLQSNGGLRLTAQDGISNAGTPEAIKAASLVLDGGNGGLGTALSPLLTNTPELSLARATDGIYLRQPSGNLVIDVVGAGKDVVLTLNNGALSQKQPGLLSLAGESVTLDVSSNVGSAAKPLVLEARSGELKLKARDAWIDAVGDALALGDSNTLGFTLRTLGTTDLRLAGNVVANGLAQWLIGGDFDADADKQLTAKGPLTLTASSVEMGLNSALTSSDGALALSSTAGPTVLSTLTAKTGMTVDAELSAIQARDASVTLTVKDAGGSVRFNSLNTGGAGLGGVAGGDALAPLRVAADHVSLSTATGDAHLRLLNPVATVDAAQAGAGKLTLDAAGHLAVAGPVSSALALSLSADKSLTMAAGSSATSGDTAALLARDGSVKVATVATVNGLSIDAAKGDISRVSLDDLLSASAPGAGIALNTNNTGGTGLGTLSAPLRLSADVVNARSASGGIYLDLLRNTTLARVDAGPLANSHIVLNAAADLRADGALLAGGDIELQVVGALTGTGAMSAGRDLLLVAASLDLGGDLAAGRDARLSSSAGDLLVRAKLAAGSNATLASTGALQAQDVQAGQDLRLEADGPVRGDSARAGRTLTVTRAPEFRMRELIAGTDMSLNLGQAEIDALTAGAGLTLDALSARLGTARSGTDARLTTSGALSLNELVSGGSTTLRADTLAAGRIQSTGSIDLAARSAGIATLQGQANALVRASDALRLDSADLTGTLDIAAASATLGSLSSGGPATLSTTGPMTLTRLSSGAAASLTAGTLDAGQIDATGNLDLNAGSASIDQLGTRANAFVRVGQALALDAASIGGALDLVAGSATLGDIGVGGNAAVSAGALSIGTLSTGGNLGVNAGGLNAGLLDSRGSLDVSAGSADIARANAAGNANLVSSTGLNLGNGQFGNDLRLSAANAVLGSVNVARDAQLDVTNALQITALSSGNLLNLRSASLTAGTLGAGGNALLSTSGALSLANGSFGADLRLQAAAAALGSVKVAGAAQLDITQALSFDALDVGRTLTLQAGRVNGQTLKVGGNALLTVADDITLAAGNFGADLSLSANNADLGALAIGGTTAFKLRGALKLSSLDSTGALDLQAAQLDLGRLRIGGAARLATPGALKLADGRFDSSLDLAARDATLGTLNVAGAAKLTTTGTLDLNNGQFGSDLAMSAANAKLATVTVAGNTTLQAQDGIELGSLQAAKQLTVTAARFTGGSAKVAGDAQLGISGALALNTGDFGANLALQAGSATLGQVKVANDAALTVAGPLKLNTLDVGRQLDLRADSLDAGTINAAGAAKLNSAGSLLLATGQFSSELAMNAGTAKLGTLKVTGNTTLQAQDGIELGTLDAVQALTITTTRFTGDSVKVTGDAQLGVSGALALNTGDFGANLALQAGSATLGKVKVANDATLAVTGPLKLDTLDVGRKLDLQADSLDAGTINALGAAKLKTDGAMLLATGSFGSSLELDARDATLGTLNVKGAADLTTTGALDLANAQFGSGLALDAGTAKLGTVTVAGPAMLRTAGSMSVGSLTAAQALQLQAGALPPAVQLARATAAIAQQAAAAPATLAINQLAATGATSLQADTITGGSWQVNTLALDANNATLASLGASGDVALNAAGALVLDKAQLAARLDSRSASAQLGDVALGTNSQLRASGLIQAQRVDAAGDLNLQAGTLALGSPPAGGASLPAIKVGGRLALEAEQITLADAAITGAATLAAKGALSLQGSTSFQGGLTADAAQVGIATATVTGDANITSGGALDVTRLTTSGNARLTAGTTLQINQLEAATADLKAPGMTLGSLKLANSLNAAATQDLLADSLVAGQSATLQAGGKLQAKLVDAASVAIDAGQQASLDLLKAGSASLRSATQIALASGEVNSITLQAPLIQGALKPANGDTVITRISGVGGTAAQNVELSVDTPLRWSLPVLDAANAQFSTTGPLVQFDDARIGDSMLLATPGGLVGLATGRARLLPGVDVQLYSSQGSFSLVRAGLAVETTALALIYKPGQRVTAPNTGQPSMVAASQSANGAKPAPAAQPGTLALNFDALLRTAPPAAGEEEEDELVGTLEVITP